ncbi:MAG: Flp pilus assembly complex ATPase component TadA [Phycisphaerales bacterium]|nr:Flp pilus assembly complex ATPase component TadA [Phycisphaerales bacterium]
MTQLMIMGTLAEGGPHALGVGLTLGEALLLVSFWKPLIILATVCCWGLIIANVYDKHAARFFLPRERWNTFHLCMGLLAVAVAVMMPVQGELAFWIGWPAMVLVLVADLVAYAVFANKDERVPEAFKINMSIFGKMGEKKKGAAVKEDKNAAKVRLNIKGPDGKPMPLPTAETPEAEVRAVAESVYIKAVEERASQFEIGPSGQQYGVVMLVDGLPVKGDVWEPGAAARVMDFWKSAAKLDLADRRKKLTAMVEVEQGQSRKKVRITSQGVQGGMRLSALFEPEAAVRRAAKDLGLLPEQMAEMQRLTSSSSGLVLLAAPADGGRTTLFYSALGMHDAYTSTVQTVEMEPQLTLEGAKHQAFDPSVEGADFATLVRSMLRRDPNVLGVSDIPDQATAKNIAMADFARTRVYAAFRASTAMEAIEGWIKAVGDPALATKHLEGAVAGRLLRKLCINCRVPYAASPDMLKKLGVPEGKQVQLFKKGGQVLIKNKPDVCPVCAGVGYIGQEGIYEVFTLGPEERAAAMENNLTAVRALLKKRQLPSMQQASIRKALDGVTSVEEVMRVTAPPGGGTASTPAPVPAGRA